MIQDHFIVGLHITNRVYNSNKVQEVLTKFGCNIKSRLGLHETHDNQCAPDGIILLEVFGEQRDIDSMMNELAKVQGVDIKTMTFPHQ